ncbi:hypothetical protein YQE_08243, partial [Dendroctonus ponderosae]
MLKPAKFLIFLVTIPMSQGLENCQNHPRNLTYYKIKSCYKSPSPVAFWKRVDSLEECYIFAREKSGLGFNFSPADAINLTEVHQPNCQVLACPETGEISSLNLNLGYDYYSAYGDLNSKNATCIKSLGLFTLTKISQNYSQSILACQKKNGELADVSSEKRTILLSQTIKEKLPGLNNAAFVGLDDIETEGVFRTSFGNLLTCSKYRAWAPGHPRSKFPSEDCVTLDAEQMWRTVKCHQAKLKALCELYPQPPSKVEKLPIPANVTCGHIPTKQKVKKRACFEEKMMFDLYQNASRVDRCALIDY